MDPAETPRFRGYRPPGGADFEGARSQIQTGFGQLDINLAAASASIAGNSNGAIVFPIAGDFLYIDTDPAASNGVATLQFNVQVDAGGAKFYAQPGEAWLTTFKQIALSWAAQPGKLMRLLYATGDRVAPAFTAAVLSTITNPASNPVLIRDQGELYGASYKSTTLLAALTPEQVFSPASNVNGAIVWVASGSHLNASTASAISLLAKVSAPTTMIDGDVIASTDSGALNATTFFHFAKLVRPIFIPAGKGLYWIVPVLETGALRSTLYTLL